MSTDRSGFATRPGQRWFEHYVEGAVHDLGNIDISAADIIEFASRFDPQSFHVDRAKAAESVFGGIIASGWHTASLMMRMLADNYLSTVASLGSPGIDELRWYQPVRPGDKLSGRLTILSARQSKSKPDRGIVTSMIEVSNQGNVVVMSLRAVNLFACRPLAPAGQSLE